MARLVDKASGKQRRLRRQKRSAKRYFKPLVNRAKAAAAIAKARFITAYYGRLKPKKDLLP